MGYGGIAYLQGVRALKIRKDDTSPAIGPTQESVLKGTYPIARNLYFYTIGSPEGLAKRFIDWARGTEGQNICLSVGYYPLPDAQRMAPAGDPPPESRP